MAGESPIHGSTPYERTCELTHRHSILERSLVSDRNDLNVHLPKNACKQACILRTSQICIDYSDVIRRS